MKLIPPVNYVLQKSPRTKPFVVHADKLKRCFSPPTTTWPVSTEGEGSTVKDTAVPAPVSDTQTVQQKQGKNQSPKRARPSVDKPSVAYEVSHPDVEDEPEVMPNIRTPRPRKTPIHLRDYVCRAVGRVSSDSGDPGGQECLRESSCQ